MHIYFATGLSSSYYSISIILCLLEFANIDYKIPSLLTSRATPLLPHSSQGKSKKSEIKAKLDERGVVHFCCCVGRIAAVLFFRFSVSVCVCALCMLLCLPCAVHEV